MKALLLTAPEKFEIAEMPVPDFGPDDLLVRVQACGICGSDVHGYDGSTGRRILVRPGGVADSLAIQEEDRRNIEREAIRDVRQRSG